MKNLEITIFIKTPIITGKYPMNLDGLLYWAAFDGSNDNEQEAQGMLKRALAQKDGVFKASDIIFMHDYGSGINATEATFTTNFNWREFALPLDKMSITETGGPYRARLTTYDALECSAVRFYAVGNPDIIEFLLDSLGFIGKGNNQGHGEISEIVVKEIDEDQSWYSVSEGKLELNRSLPKTLVDDLLVKDDNRQLLEECLSGLDETGVRFAPPYTTSPTVLGFSPKFKRAIML